MGVIVALVTLFPIFWMVSTAFKPPSELFSLTPHPLPLHPTLHNFSEVMNGHAAGLGISFWVFARNSLLVTVVTVVVASIVSLLAAVAVARFRFRFRVTFLITGGLGNRDEYNLSLYLYDKAFTMPPSYGLGAALALILTVILLIITVGYVRASVRQGALT